MSRARFLDDLARTLAQPMPRRRALRLAAGALVGMAFPSAVASMARAGVVPGNHTCNPDGTESCRCFEGSAGPGTVMKATCGAGRKCVCRTTSDPSYGPGVQNKIDCDPGSRCGKKVCGPDITAAVDQALARVKSEFAGWSALDRAKACASLVTLPLAAISWDIAELGPGGRERFAKRSSPGCSTCGFSVQVGRDCHYSGSVNYVVFGVMMRLCDDHYSKAESAFADWFSQEAMLELIYIHKNQTLTQAANFQASNEWALAGYQTGSVRPTPPGDRKECRSCPNPYEGPGLTVRWYPFVIRPNP